MLTKGECVMKDVPFDELEGQYFKEISEITKPRETDKDGFK